MKRTLLWLRDLPPLIPDHTEKPEGCKKLVNAGTKKKDGTKLSNIGEASSSKDRSKTFRGVAEAMARQWGSYVLECLNHDEPTDSVAVKASQIFYMEES